jgi:hypothetical protein
MLAILTGVSTNLECLSGSEKPFLSLLCCVYKLDAYQETQSSMSVLKQLGQVFPTIMKLCSKFVRDEGREELAPDPRSMAHTIRSLCLDS